MEISEDRFSGAWPLIDFEPLQLRRNMFTAEENVDPKTARKLEMLIRRSRL